MFPFRNFLLDAINIEVRAECSASIVFEVECKVYPATYGELSFTKGILQLCVVRSVGATEGVTSNSTICIE